MQPIVIVGCQRSGSTMLGSMLGAHSEMAAIPEAQFFVDCMPSIKEPFNVSKIVEQIKQHYRFKIWNYSFPPVSENFSTYQEVFESLVKDYALKIHDKKGLKYWVDHQPGHVKHIAKIKNYYRGLKVINIIRDGRAVANSIMPLDWGPNAIHKAAYFWEQRIGYGFAVQRFLGEEQCLTVHYEHLVENPNSSMKTICDFLGLEFEDAMLETSGLKVPKFTTSQHNLVGQGLVNTRSDGWKTELSQREIEIFEKLTGDMLTYLGYSPITTQQTTFKLRERLLLEVSHLIKVLANKYAFRRRVKRFS